MIWTLKICVGLIWGLCGHIQYLQFPDEAKCLAQQNLLLGRKDITYAICFKDVKQ